jgi:hypothetical protein
MSGVRRAGRAGARLGGRARRRRWRSGRGCSACTTCGRTARRSTSRGRCSAARSAQRGRPPEPRGGAWRGRATFGHAHAAPTPRPPRTGCLRDRWVARGVRLTLAPLAAVRRCGRMARRGAGGLVAWAAYHVLVRLRGRRALQVVLARRRARRRVRARLAARPHPAHLADRAARAVRAGRRARRLPARAARGGAAAHPPAPRASVRSLDAGEVADEIADAAERLSRSSTGAIIAVERDLPLSDYLETGTPLSAKVSGDLLATIFTPYSPLHDGAVVIRGDTIVGAGCILPLAQTRVDDRSLGTRHRAALGLAEESDALVVVVSEETGTISLAAARAAGARPRPGAAARRAHRARAARDGGARGGRARRLAVPAGARWRRAPRLGRARTRRGRARRGGAARSRLRGDRRARRSRSGTPASSSRRSRRSACRTRRARRCSSPRPGVDARGGAFGVGVAPAAALLSARARPAPGGVTAALLARWTGSARAASPGALCAGGMSTAWANATEPEVYAPALLLALLAVLAADVAGRRRAPRRAEGGRIRWAAGGTPPRRVRARALGTVAPERARVRAGGRVARRRPAREALVRRRLDRLGPRRRGRAGRRRGAGSGLGTARPGVWAVATGLLVLLMATARLHRCAARPPSRPRSRRWRGARRARPAAPRPARPVAEPGRARHLGRTHRRARADAVRAGGAVAAAGPGLAPDRQPLRVGRLAGGARPGRRRGPGLAPHAGDRPLRGLRRVRRSLALAPRPAQRGRLGVCCWRAARSGWRPTSTSRRGRASARGCSRTRRRTRRASATTSSPSAGGRGARGPGSAPSSLPGVRQGGWRAGGLGGASRRAREWRSPRSLWGSTGGPRTAAASPPLARPTRSRGRCSARRRPARYCSSRPTTTRIRSGPRRRRGSAATSPS